jgi:protein involved in polysaccharide export with SLBB domain
MNTGVKGTDTTDRRPIRHGDEGRNGCGFVDWGIAVWILLLAAGCRPGFAAEPAGNPSSPKPARSVAEERRPERRPEGRSTAAAKDLQAHVRRSPGGQESVSVEGRIESGDLVEVRVFQEPDFDTRIRVGPGGGVEVPFVGTVLVSGATPQEAARRIEGRLAEGFLVRPRVSVVVQEKAQRFFTVLGQVQKPGTYRFPAEVLRAGGGGLDLMQALGLAGGFTRLAAPSRVTVRRGARPGGGGTAPEASGVRRVDARLWMEQAGTPPLWIQPGDVITVGERIF